MPNTKLLTVYMIIALAAAYAVSATADQNRKKGEVELIDEEIYWRKSTGQLRRLTHDGQPKAHARLSPSGDRVIYHTAYDPYKSPSEPLLFTVLDVGSGNTIKQIPVHWPARYVSSVTWIDDRFVMVRGEARYLALLDVKTGKQSHNLVGAQFTLSPDGTKLVFHHDFNPRYGPIPPEYQSDYVLLSLVRRAAVSGQGTGRFHVSNFKVIYPVVLPWERVERKRCDDLDERHRVKSPFAWSSDSRRVAFVEAQRQRLWLVVLSLHPGKNDVAVSHKRFDLDQLLGGSLALSWVSGKDQIKVRADNTAWLVDVEAGKVQRRQ